MFREVVREISPYVRWILFLPLAIVGSLLFTSLTNLIFQSTMTYQGVMEGTFWWNFERNIIASGATALSFVYLGAMVAPEKQKAVAGLLGAATLVLGVIMVILFFASPLDGATWWELASDIWFIIVGCVTAYSIRTGEMELKKL